VGGVAAALAMAWATNVAASAGASAGAGAAAGAARGLAPPTPGQTRGYDALREEADVYQRGASDYEATVSTIIGLHYEEKKSAILGRLDREIGSEKTRLKQARETAIRRLEEFVASHSGANAIAGVTPDAMYRLAALYEERARTDADADPNANASANADPAAALKPAIALYKRVVREFPAYREMAGVYYFLGHALGDAGRQDESQQVWRSLVCHNRYAYPVAADAKDQERDAVAPLPQDHDESYWRAWRVKYGRPEALKKGAPDETSFEDPYPQDCRSLAQPDVAPGQAPKYVAEVWWRIGEWEFDQNDAGGGVLASEPFAVWDYDRAASAYAHALATKKPPVYGIALYKYAWTLFKQERYEAAVREFVHLLEYTDEQERRTGNPGADFRQEAYTYIAGSLDNLDFIGPGPDAPAIARPDILDTAKSPAEAEAKLRVAVDRVQDPRLVPQDAPWTIAIYQALGLELRAIGQYRNALAVYQLVLDKWPLDPTAPETQNAIAEVDELLARQTKIGEERRGYEQQVLVARTALSHYVGDTPWVDANKDHPTALRRAEELVRTGLKGAAVTHTRNGQAAVDRAARTADPGEKARVAAYALDEYRLAAVGWRGVVQQEKPDAPDAYQTRYLLADALHQEVRLAVQLDALDARAYPEPTSQEIAAAIDAAVAVRDSDEDDSLIDNAGLFVVDLADVGRDLAFARNRASAGAQGTAPRTAVRLDGAEGDRHVVVDPIPDVIAESIAARDAYVARVPPDRDVHGHAADYALYAADQLFVYGHFDQARDRFEPMVREHCGKDALGYEAWKHLIVMSNLSRHAARSRALALAEKKQSCAFTREQKDEESRLTDGVLETVSFDEALAAYEKARAAPASPGRRELWVRAAAMNEAAQRAAPAHDEAPRAALIAASAYQQAGDAKKAIDLYELYVASYGGDDALARLQSGETDPATHAKVGPWPEAYKQRVADLGRAREALSGAYAGIFAYDKAAASYASLATNARLDEGLRVASARAAMVLYSTLGDRDDMLAMHAVLVDPKMQPSPETRVEADFVKAGFEYERWIAAGGHDSGDSGDAAALRRSAVAALVRFHDEVRGKPEGARRALEAAHRVATMMRAGNDAHLAAWLRTTVADWDYFDAHSQTARETARATDAPFADWGAQADFELVDRELRSGFDTAAGRPRYRGTVLDVSKQVDADLDAVNKKWKGMLDRVAQRYDSFEWATAATAREGSLYDTIRTGLDLVSPVYFTPQQTALFDKLNALANRLAAAGNVGTASSIQQKVADMQQQVRDAWRVRKDAYFAQCNQPMIRLYATAVVAARKNDLSDSTVHDALSRLAYYTGYLGDDVMKPLVEATRDPTDASRMLAYTDGMFLRWRPGIAATPPPSGQPAPLPVAP
jgi:tetratricopeptide (TPR) repeat protein